MWWRNGLSHPELASLEGRVLFESVHAPMAISRLLGGPTVEAYLLARHAAIDVLLERAIEQDGVTQVIEVAAGLSPRGWRFHQRYGSRVTYIEADLPAMAERKQSALERMETLSEHHRVELMDALRDGGPGSLAALTAKLDPTEGLAIVTEGLLNYLDRDSMLDLWHRFALELRAFRTGHYVSDLFLESTESSVQTRAFRLALSAFVRGRVRPHFSSSDEAVAALGRAGFRHATVLQSLEVPGVTPANLDPGSRLGNVIDAVA